MLYFAYGANTHRSNMAYRCPEAEWVGLARLTGYALTFRGVADLIPSRGSETFGALWDITDRDLAALDRFEGYPRLYGRKAVMVAVTEVRGRTALPGKVRPLVYIMQPGHALAVPSPTYLVTLREGYADCGLPSAQLESALNACRRTGGSSGYRSRQWEVLA